MNLLCPKCSNQLKGDENFCQICGCNLELEFIEEPTCPRCKKTYTKYTKFCVLDGCKLVEAKTIVPICAICNKSYNEDIKFCPDDGGIVSINYTKKYNKNKFENQLIENQQYKKAPLSDRFVAGLLDGLISTALSIPAIVFLIIGNINASIHNNENAGGLISITIFLYLIPITYSLIKDGLGDGQSWGKRAVNLMVVNLDDNVPCNIEKSFFRNFISSILLIIPLLGWLIEPLMVIMTIDGRKLGDKAANTQVIEKNN